MTKLNMKTVEGFGFDMFQQQMIEERENLENLFDNDDFQKRRKMNTHHVYRFFPKLKTRAQKIFVPSMLFLSCNSLEMVRLRHVLVHTVLQASILSEVYQKQMSLMRKDYKP
mmetsp:Transcript_23051/g.22440  ORF Transcript_23051/g.22440 Transcript_23051/m.22440 type:complete len:112 (+) Transcript_23051:1112-1447(+)